MTDPRWTVPSVASVAGGRLRVSDNLFLSAIRSDRTRGMLVSLALSPFCEMRGLGVKS